MSADKPLLRSKKHVVYLLTCVLLVGLQAAGAEHDVVVKIADAIWLGLPILLAGQSWIDSKRQTVGGGGQG